MPRALFASTYLSLEGAQPVRQAAQAVVPLDGLMRLKELLREAVVYLHKKSGADFAAVLEEQHPASGVTYNAI